MLEVLIVLNLQHRFYLFKKKKALTKKFYFEIN